MEIEKLNIITEKDLLLRAKKSNLDYLEGNVIFQEDLEKESKNW